jgi:hypothetical protein
MLSACVAAPYGNEREEVNYVDGDNDGKGAGVR